MKKSFLYPIIFMAILTAIFTFILAFMDYSTADQIAFLQDTDLRSKILYIFDIEIDSNEPEEIDKVFKANIEEEKIEGERYFHLVKDGERLAHAFPVGGAGLWGSVEGYVGITSDYTSITGLEFISHSETPGLGGRISEEEFKGQFRGLSVEGVEGQDFIIYRPATGGNADAITGATLTSKSVSNFLNEDIYEYLQNRKEGY